MANKLWLVTRADGVTAVGLLHRSFEKADEAAQRACLADGGVYFVLETVARYEPGQVVRTVPAQIVEAPSED